MSHAEPPQAAGSVLQDETLATGTGAGKILLAGEHTAVYQRHALAVPVRDVMRCKVQMRPEAGVFLRIPAWGVNLALSADGDDLLQRCVRLILQHFGLGVEAPLVVHVEALVQRGSGLGGSAALAVAVIRALAAHTGQRVDNAQVNAWAYESECLAHGTPSGVDNTVSTYGECLLFRKAEPPWLRTVHLGAPVRLVVGMTGQRGSTLDMVRQVAQGRDANPALYERLFDRVDALTLNAVAALEQGDLPLLGALMNENQRLLQQLEVSSVELDELCALAHLHGALGAKLTGAGGGGAMIALALAEQEPKILAAMQREGYEAMALSVG